MKSYLRHLVEYCRDKGYIQTITGRKRYLPHITSTNTHAKAQVSKHGLIGSSYCFFMRIQTLQYPVKMLGNMTVDN